MINRVRSVLVAALALLVGLSYSHSSRTQASRSDFDGEVRALWVQRATLTAAETIARMVSEARDAGFNTLLVQARGRGDAFFTSSIEPRGASLAGQPASFDPLAVTLELARRAGLRVHAWVNVNLVASATELPASQQHVIYKHPDWLMVPRELAREMAAIDRDSPGYVSKLAEHARAQAAQVEGLYLSPVTEEAASYTTSIVVDLVKRYDLDGVHFDYIRYPSDEFDYSSGALALFRQELLSELAAGERDRHDARLVREPTIYADAFPERWAAFRRDRLTRLVSRLRDAIKAHRRDVVVSAAVMPDSRDAFVRRLQDWRAWSGAGLLDALCPMAYTADAATFRAQIESMHAVAKGTPVWAGIGAYRLSSSETIENIETAREAGARGVVLFSYDNLAGAPGRPGSLAEIGRAAFR